MKMNTQMISMKNSPAKAKLMDEYVQWRNQRGGFGGPNPSLFKSIQSNTANIAGFHDIAWSNPLRS